MSSELSWLTLSFLAAHILHGGLLYTQRNERKITISHHAAKNNRTFTMYIIGHLLAATSIFIFVEGFFAETPQGQMLVGITAVGCLADIIQAFIPARGKAEKYHQFFAYVMALSVVLIGMIAAFSIPQNNVASITSKALAVVVAASIPFSRFVDKKNFYKIQMISLFLFYMELFVLYFGIK